MSWKRDLEDRQEQFKRRTFGVLTSGETWAALYLCGELVDYEEDPDGWRRNGEATQLLKQAVDRVAPVIEAGADRKPLLEERDALRTRLATIEALLNAEDKP